jgi:hypothetical protein
MDIDRTRRLFRDCARYGWEKFQQAHLKMDTDRSRDIRLIDYMSQAQVNFEAVVSLTAPHKAQSMAAMLNVRVLQEYYINLKLMTLRDDDCFANYLYINSEYKRINTADILLRLKEISHTEHCSIIDEANKLINSLKSSTELPPVPKLIIPGKDYYGKLQFDLRRRCEIIDVLDATNLSTRKLVDNYGMIYKHLSNYIHPDARTILESIGYDNSSSAIIINGDKSSYNDVIVLSYMYYTAILAMFTESFELFDQRRFDLFSMRYYKYAPSAPGL